MTAHQGYCGVCGWPLEGAACDACGAPAGMAPVAEDHVNILALGGPQPEDFPQLKSAFTAWKQKDWNRLVGQCLLSLGVENPQITNLPDGPGWTFALESAAVYMSIDKPRGMLAVESPMVLVPARQRVPLLRALLEMNASTLGASRFCLRGDLVVLRFADRLENLSPPKLVGAIREVALRADRHDDLLSIAFSAKLVGHEAQNQGMPWRFIGTPRKLDNLRGADAGPAPPSGGPVSQPSRVSPLAPQIALGGLAPVPARPASHDMVRLEEQLRAADGLCDLLRAALELSTPLDFMKAHPAAHLLLQRAAIFRAHAEFRDSCPAAVSLLFRHGAVVVARLWENDPQKPLDWSEAPSALVMGSTFNQVIARRAQVGEQDPLGPEQFKSAPDAKAHFKRLMAEIDRSPRDDAYRIYVLLGAAAELLARARLPASIALHLKAAVNESQRRPRADGVVHLGEAIRKVLA